MGTLQDQMWDVNKLQPWGMKMNMAAENKQAGMSNLFGGLQDMGSSIMNYAGTKAMLDVYKGMNPQQTPMQNPNQQFSQPLGGVNPQNNLLNTLNGMMPKSLNTIV